MSVLIKNGRIVTAADDYHADVFIADQTVSLIGRDLSIAADTIIDASGRLVIPVESEFGIQELVRLTRRGRDKFDSEEMGGVRFVPLIGEQGWQPNGDRNDGDPALA